MRIRDISNPRLSELPNRWQVAGEWEHLLALAGNGPVTGRWRVRPMTDRILAARSEIERLTAALYSLEPVNPCGVAMARRLARDGAGPLYNPSSGRSLVAALDESIAALDTRRAARVRARRSSADRARR
jgi:hypothetical protein